MKITETEAIDMEGWRYVFKREKFIFFYLKTRCLTLVTFFIIIALGFVFEDEILKVFHPKEGLLNFGNLFNVITLIFVIAVWWSELKKEWRNSLPKYLTVHFKYTGKEPLQDGEIGEYSEYYVPLIHQSDSRSMAQSLGQVFNKGERLKLNLKDQKIQTKLYFYPDCNFAFNHYIVTLPIDEPLLKKTKK